MNKSLTLLLFSAVLISGCVSVTAPPILDRQPFDVSTLIPQVSTNQQLDALSVFSFAIMSDNKGDGPDARPEFAAMTKWLQDSQAAFVIGMGDHLKKKWRNDFLDLLANNDWWRTHFLPGIADGENEFYGDSQGDWGAGKTIMTTVAPGPDIKLSVEPNGVDYYTVIQIKGYTVHWIHGHFPDTPEDPDLAFPLSTRAYLVETVRAIRKGPRDLIIVGAHSLDGFWIQLMSESERDLLLTKADLILSATTHIFDHRVVPGYEANTALVINTGSITYPNSYCPPGYVQVHVLESPLRLIVQYLDARLPERELQIDRYSLMKVVGGGVTPVGFRAMRPEEDLNRIITTINRPLSAEELSSILQELSKTRLAADVSFLTVELGLSAGPISLQNLWQIAPFNDKIGMVTITKENWDIVYDKPAPEELQGPIKVVLNDFWVHRAINRLKLTPDQVTFTDTTIHELLLEGLNALPTKQEDLK